MSALKYISIAVICGALLVLPALAQSTNDYAIQAEIGLGGMFKPGGLTPLTVDVIAHEPLRGTLHVAVPRSDLLSASPTYVHLTSPVTLLPGEGRRVQWDIPLVASPYPLEMTLRDGDGRPLQQVTVNLREHAVQGPLLLVAGAQGNDWGWLQDHYTDGTVPAHLRPRITRLFRTHELPTSWAAYTSLSAVVLLNDVRTAHLSKAQVDALTTYVRAGGHLIVVGGHREPDLPLLWWALFPEITGATAPLHVADDAVPQWAWEIDTSSERTMAGSEAPWLSRDLGAGMITVIPWDPSHKTMAPTAQPDIARHVFDPDRLPPGTFPVSDDGVWRVLNLARSTPLESTYLAMMLSLYTVAVTACVLLAGRRPVFYAIALVLIVAGTAVAVITVNGVGLREGTIYGEAKVSHVLPGGTAPTKTFILGGSLAPAATDVTITGSGPIPFPSHFQPGFDVPIHHDVQYEQAFTYSHPGPGSIMRWTHTSVEHIAIDATITDEEQRRLVMQNRSGHHLTEVYFIDGRRYTPLGPLRAGTTASWPYPMDTLHESGWIGVNLHTQLLRKGVKDRPDDVAIRLLALAAERGYDETISQKPPYVIGLLKTPSALTFTPVGKRLQWQLAVIPVLAPISPTLTAR